jgi:hypothetical protein
MIRFENTLFGSSIACADLICRTRSVQNVDATRRAVTPIELHQEVIIYGYVDFQVHLLAKMYGKRRAGYNAIGYEINAPESLGPSIQLKREIL